jgi:cysteine desulfurase
MVGKETELLAKLPIDFLSWSGHKFGAPKGVGGLYVRRGARLRPFVWGGHQERTRRSGTENLPGILGMAEAIEESREAWAAAAELVRARRDRLEAALVERVPEAVVNGAGAPRNENTLNLCFPRIEGAAVVLTLSERGLDCSSGSACSASDPGPSHVLAAMGRSHDLIHGSVRLSLAPSTTDADIDFAIEAIEAAWRYVARVQAN